MASPATDRYGSIDEADDAAAAADPETMYSTLPDNSKSSGSGSGDDDPRSGLMRHGAPLMQEDGLHVEDDDEEYEIHVDELLYSTASYYAIAKPVTLTMVLAALCVVYVNTDETRSQGEAAMANAYQVWHVDGGGNGETLALSLANALVMVAVICAMTFVIVLLYRLKCMLCLIGYMMVCSGTLLGVLGGNLVQTAIAIYNVSVDKLTFGLFIFNFAIVGILSVFYGQGIPQYVTQGYLICTAVILAWHLSYFDDWTTWTLLFMLAIYDLCAVLTPCGPLKALVELMSQDGAHEMPGLLFEAQLPPEAKRPGVPRNASSVSHVSTSSSAAPATPSSPRSDQAAEQQQQPDGYSGIGDERTSGQETATPKEAPIVHIPLAIAKVYNLDVVAVPAASKPILYPQRYNNGSNASASPLLTQEDDDERSIRSLLPENPTPQQLRTNVTVRLPLHGGRLEQVSRRGKRVYLERDRTGAPKRLLWVDRNGKVFCEMRDDDEEGDERNSIRLGLGDFIFYSVLVAKAAEYSFATFIACMLVILAGLGGTLVLLSVYHHALPALPISIFLGVFFYLATRLFIEPWMEAVLTKPYYV